VSEVYGKVHTLISCQPVKDYVPYSWVCLAQVKREHYTALSHYHTALGVMGARMGDMSAQTRDTLQFLHAEDENKTRLEIRVPQDDDERKLLGIKGIHSRVRHAVQSMCVIGQVVEKHIIGRAHLRESLLLHEESQRLHRMCRELRGKAALSGVLKKCHTRALDAYTAAEEEDDFREVLDPPRILHGSLVFTSSLHTFSSANLPRSVHGINFDFYWLRVCHQQPITESVLIYKFI
ncbi:unnamed protein product, partial [Timema podura]|nr:unnamed protein product [Timema podura]